MNKPPQIISITKLDAARRHLTTAITLWFADGDPVAIHSLGYAAYEVIHVLSKNASRKETLLYDTDIIRDEFRADFNKLVRKAPNFFKHADRDPDGTIQFMPQFTEMFFLFSILGLETMGLKLGAEEKAFLLWLSIHNPSIMADGAMQKFLQGFPIKVVDEARGIPKTEFYKHVMTGHRAGLQVSLRR
jgi:hypothetical protein